LQYDPKPTASHAGGQPGGQAATGRGGRSNGPKLDMARIKAYIRIVASSKVPPELMKQEFYLISVAARLAGMHPQTLRKYERLGLVQPGRTIGSMRVYSRDELERLRLIKHLVDELGINLAGVQRLLSIADVIVRIRPLAHDEALEPTESRRQLEQEIERLCAMLGL
jgi:MerR family transcriptional regulator, heat shock protein HspR